MLLEPRPTMPFPDLLPLPPPILDIQMRPVFWELFSPPRVAKVLGAELQKGSRSMDIITGWNLLQEPVQRSLCQDLIARQPYFLMASPPCTHLCSLAFSNWNRKKREKAVRELHEGLCHVDTTAWCCNLQTTMGGPGCLAEC